MIGPDCTMNQIASLATFSMRKSRRSSADPTAGPACPPALALLPPACASRAASAKARSCRHETHDLSSASSARRSSNGHALRSASSTKSGCSQRSGSQRSCGAIARAICETSSTSSSTSGCSSMARRPGSLSTAWLSRTTPMHWWSSR